ncbi:cytosolic iron-sulfur assembly component 2B [Notechis scutatus]|uniref:Cytosolic iron-sulfur assembly component 2B n=1 Tax=Notechis scutatus TaxID=8663 RepID=A0A6J1W3H0_9SAUR|nr:cytosolic iron-sulfur assembly component 2B [Notechis scutatus]
MVGPLGGGGGGGGLENANPLVYRRQGERPTTAREQDEGLPDAIDDREIFDLIRGIHDPEHPLTLEELNVVEQLRVQVSDAGSAVSVEFTPTIPHCSMATLIGLSIKVKLIRSLPERFKVSGRRDLGSSAPTQRLFLLGTSGALWIASRSLVHSESSALPPVFLPHVCCQTLNQPLRPGSPTF